jgi:hypothetical protein
MDEDQIVKTFMNSKYVSEKGTRVCMRVKKRQAPSSPSFPKKNRKQKSNQKLA